MALGSLITGGGLQSRPANLGRLAGPLTAGRTQSRKSANSHRVFASSNQGTRSANEALQRLGLRQGASEQEIKRAYRKLALKFHPDVCQGDSCTSNFMQINDAYEVIMDCLQGNGEALAVEPFVGESMMGVYDENWEDWEEWMGWEGAGTMDYSNHINHAL